MGRGVLGIFAWMGVLIAIGLILTHSSGANQIENTTFTGIGNIVKDLSLQNTKGTHG